MLSDAHWWKIVTALFWLVLRELSKNVWEIVRYNRALECECIFLLFASFSKNWFSSFCLFFSFFLWIMLLFDQHTLCALDKSQSINALYYVLQKLNSFYYLIITISGEQFAGLHSEENPMISSISGISVAQYFFFDGFCSNFGLSFRRFPPSMVSCLPSNLIF